jgi:hypothetical protein
VCRVTDCVIPLLSKRSQVERRISGTFLVSALVINAQMDVPEYITKEEVRRVCSAIGIRDWTALTEAKVKIEEAAVIQKLVGGEALAISSEDFRDGLEVELEHGLAFSDANVTNNHPILTGRIVLAHLKETLDYYVRLRVAEIEGAQGRGRQQFREPHGKVSPVGDRKG